MSKICYNCGNENIDEAKFCTKCGKEISERFSSNSLFKFIYYKLKEDIMLNKSSYIMFLKSFVIVCLIIVIGGFITSKIDFNDENTYIVRTNLWAVEAACKEVKSDFYSSYAAIPEVDGELIYQDDQNYVVAVRYQVPEWGVKASCACLIYGYGEDNCFLYGMTNEMTYDYNYKENLEELKALWKLD